MTSSAASARQSEPQGLLDLSGSRIVEAYLKKTPTSAKLAKRARQVLPSGVTHDVRYIEPHGIYATHARGSRKWDVDGNEYVCHSGGHGALLLGHCHPAVVEAVQTAVAKGTQYGASHEAEIEWAEMICQMLPCAERVRFTNTGTEATLMALRLARAYTGKPKILRFHEHFHGWQDHALVKRHVDVDVPSGIIPEIASNVVSAPPWDFEETRKIIEANDDIAVAIVEPTGSAWGQVPVAPQFLESLREITRERGIVLIFDEVVTGFRCSPGGAQGALGITPDIATVGKVVAGGVHGGAVTGRADILNLMDFRHTHATGRQHVEHYGTYNALATSCAAGIAALTIVRSTDACERATRAGRAIQSSLNELFAKEGVRWISYGTYGGFHVFPNFRNVDTTPDELESGKFDADFFHKPRNPTFLMKMRVGLMLHGVDTSGLPGGTVSSVHTDEDREVLVEAFRQTIRMLREEGELE